MGGHKQKKKMNLKWATQETYVFSNRSVPARNMRKTDLGSVIFGCKNSTINECLSKQLFGLPEGHFSYIKNIRKGLALFLFNYSNRTLHGIFEAATPGQMNIDKYAWVPDGDDTGYTNYPAQVRISVRQDCRPLSEKQFGCVIANNYYETKHFYFELDHDQTNQLISLFRLNSFNEEMYPQIPTRLNNVNQSVSSMSRDRSRSPSLGKRFHRDRASYRDALCKRDKRKPACRNCKESGLLSSECRNDPMCNMCGKRGHLAAECTNEKACNNCRKTGHIARECSNDPVCNICSISGHVARQCPRSGMSGSAKSRPSSFLGSFGSSRDDPFWDICRNCGRPGHISCNCFPMSMRMVICNNCGGRGHMEIECPSAPRFISFDRAYPEPRFHRY